MMRRRRHGKRKSNSVLPEAKKKLKVADNLTSKMHFVLQTRWLAATTVGDDVLNYITIKFPVHRYAVHRYAVHNYAVYSYAVHR